MGKCLGPSLYKLRFCNASGHAPAPLPLSLWPPRWSVVGFALHSTQFRHAYQHCSRPPKVAKLWMSVRSDVAFECAVWRGQAATYQSLCTDLLLLNAVACCSMYLLPNCQTLSKRLKVVIQTRSQLNGAWKKWCDCNWNCSWNWSIVSLEALVRFWSTT